MFVVVTLSHVAPASGVRQNPLPSVARSHVDESMKKILCPHPQGPIGGCTIHVVPPSRLSRIPASSWSPHGPCEPTSRWSGSASSIATLERSPVACSVTVGVNICRQLTPPSTDFQSPCSNPYPTTV